jgi:putative membrane protein
LPAWAPWDFSWLWFLATAAALWWYFRGVALAGADERPAAWRTLAYVAGVLVIYAVVQTHFEYLAEHMFFLNRVQHMVLHHLGPFLIALAWPGDSVRRGMPAVFRPIVDARLCKGLVNFLQQPALAAFLFVGLIGLWLIPPVHFRAMIDPKLYQVMNWSMVIDGVLFWTLVLDPRPKPLARVSFGGRVALALVVVPPQIVLGAAIAFWPHDLYTFYDWCGRIYPAIDAMADQQLAGANIWIPPAMMSGVALIVVINALRLQDEKEEASQTDDETDISATRWTGL